MNPIVFVAGARPNFMKVAPILRALKRQDSPPPHRLVHTGQHYDAQMSAVFFEQLGLPAPDAHLEVGSASHGQQTARVLEAFERYLLALDGAAGVVVVGDVNSTLAATLAAVKLGIPVAHVEAGLRSFDRAMPEEINRLATDAIADVLLVSEPSGEDNLRREGIDPQRIHYVGNVMIDSLLAQVETARAIDLGQFGVQERGYVLVTLHRPSNVDVPERLAEVVELLEWLGAHSPLVFPLHPRTQQRLEASGLLQRLQAASGVHLSPPVGHRELVRLMMAARVVLTDSGGIQEETSALRVPCLTLRTSTERPATVALGTNRLVGHDLTAAKRYVQEILRDDYRPPVQEIPGWDGRAGERIAALLPQLWRDTLKEAV